MKTNAYFNFKRLIIKLLNVSSIMTQKASNQYVEIINELKFYLRTNGKVVKFKFEHITTTISCPEHVTKIRFCA